jgi:mannose/fructose-specific phosphotransferase system component IIA
VAARQQGITVDELLAATSIMATAKGTADEGGSRLNALLSALAVTEPQLDRRGRVRRDSPLQESLRGRSLADISGDEKLGAMTPAQLQKVLGSREAVEAFGVLREQAAKLRELTTQVGQGVQENKLERGIAIVEGDRRAMAGVNLQAQEGRREVERLDRGADSLEVDAMLIEGQRQVEQAPQAGLLRRLFNATPVGIGLNLMQGDPLSALSGLNLPMALIGNAAKSEAGMMAASGLRTGLEAVGGDAVFLDMMRRIGLGGDKQAASADKLADAADKLTAAADRLGTMTPGPRDVNRTGPARLEAAGAN